MYVMSTTVKAELNEEKSTTVWLEPKCKKLSAIHFKSHLSFTVERARLNNAAWMSTTIISCLFLQCYDKFFVTNSSSANINNAITYDRMIIVFEQITNLDSEILF